MENENQLIKEKCDCGQCAQCRGFFGTKTNGIFLLILIVLMVIAIVIMLGDKQKYFPMREDVIEEVVQDDEQVKDTFTYTNYGFSIELPKGATPRAEEAEGGPATIIFLSEGNTMAVNHDMEWWNKYDAQNLAYVGTEQIGSTTFKIYNDKDNKGWVSYLYQKGNVGYQFTGDKNLLKTFKFVGWPQIEGNKEDLVSFSIKPGQEVSGKVNISGIIKGAYFFEANADILIMDANKNILRTTYITGLGDWMTSGPVSFTGVLDFTGLPKGPGFITIQTVKGEDNAPLKQQIFIPIVIK